MDNEENKAQMRVRAGSAWSKIARVTDAAGAGRADAAEAAVVVIARGAGECGREGSGNDMEGKDDVGESKLSHGGESDGSPALACGSAGVERVGGAFELVDRGKFCCCVGGPSCECECELALSLAPGPVLVLVLVLVLVPGMSRLALR